MSEWQRAYQFDPSQNARRYELGKARAERELTKEELEEYRWLVFSHTNFLLVSQRKVKPL